MSGLNELVLDCALRRESGKALLWESALAEKFWKLHLVTKESSLE